MSNPEAMIEIFKQYLKEYIEKYDLTASYGKGEDEKGKFVYVKIYANDEEFLNTLKEKIGGVLNFIFG